MLTRVSQAQGGGRVPEWLATHPNPENRRARIEQEIAALPQNFSGAAVNRDIYLRRLDGLVFGNNPREGYFKENQFFHPDLRFRVTFPEGWTTNNGKQAVIAVSPQQDAMVEVSVAKEPTADAAARAFLAQQGLTSGYPVRTSVGGLPVVTAGFAPRRYARARQSGRAADAARAGPAREMDRGTAAALWITPGRAGRSAPSPESVRSSPGPPDQSGT